MNRKLRMLLLLTLIVIGVASSYGNPTHQIDTLYYTNWTYVTQCGRTTEYCDGRIVHTGCTSQNYEVVLSECL
ncbi:MAG TPA: hypothetical protein VF618_26100 [Thermoanaerobaculia bacterium]